MKNKQCRSILVCCIFSLAGCHSSSGHVISARHQMDVAQPPAVPVSEPDEGRKKDVSHLIQCNRDLESLRTVDAAQYRRYQLEYDTLMKNSEEFLTVKDEVSPEVAALARPRFQYALVNLCYRIKDTLAHTLIKQAGGER